MFDARFRCSLINADSVVRSTLISKSTSHIWWPQNG